MSTQNRTLRASPPRVSVSVVSTTVAFALSRGLSIEEIEAATGVGGLDLVDADARLSDEVLVDLWRLLSERHPDVALPLKMARAAPMSFFSGLAHGIQYASDLRSALTHMVEHRAVVADRIQLAVEESGNEASLVTWHPLDARDGGRVAEVGIALVRRLITETLGVENSLSRVEFAHARVGTLDDYQQFFGTEVLFKQSRNALVLHRVRLDAPVREANADLFAYVEQHFERLRNRIQRSGYPAELAALREAVEYNAARGEFGAAHAAARAGLGLRVAQRLAAHHGTSLKSLIGDARARSARAMLSQSGASIETVASAVGYSDARAFRRAFKRLNGQSPSRFRETMQVRNPDGVASGG